MQSGHRKLVSGVVRLSLRYLCYTRSRCVIKVFSTDKALRVAFDWQVSCHCSNLSATMPLNKIAPSHLFETNFAIQSSLLLSCTRDICHAKCIEVAARLA